MAQHNQCHFHSYLFGACLFQIQNSLIGMPATYHFFLPLSSRGIHLKKFNPKISASPALWNASYVTPKDDYWIEKREGEKRFRIVQFHFSSKRHAAQTVWPEQALLGWGEDVAALFTNSLFKPLSSCPLSGTWHKGVWLVFARTVLFIFACLMVNLGSVHTAGWTGKSRHSCLLGIATMHWHTRGPALL